MARWPHAPPHWTFNPGSYIVTASTYHKAHLLNTPEKKSMVQSLLFELAEERNIRLLAWAILSNHYHLVLSAEYPSPPIRDLIARLHNITATRLNRMDGTPGRKVWFQFWDTEITYSKSFLARLAYVHSNPVRHGIVKRAQDYPWSSMAWFERSAPRAFVETVASFPIDRVRVPDDF